MSVRTQNVEKFIKIKKLETYLELEIHKKSVFIPKL